ncbi:hypothetical protein [Nonomuraea basaltis]|nr:hypothetical protein [Nonomuraea basaltis]
MALANCVKCGAGLDTAAQFYETHNCDEWLCAYCHYRAVAGGGG